MKEKLVRRAVKRELARLGGFWLPIHGSPFQPRAIDLVGCFRGRFIGIELKRPGGKPTAHQSLTLRRIIESGGLAATVSSKNMLKNLLDPLTNSPEPDKVKVESSQPDSKFKRESSKMASKKNQKAAKVEEEEEEDELEDLEELGDEEDEPAPKAKRTRTAKTKTAKTQDGIGIAEIAEEAGVTGATVRRYLRSNADGPRETKTRYHFSSLDSREVKAILKGLAEQAEEKEEPAPKAKATKKAKKGKKSKK